MPYIPPTRPFQQRQEYGVDEILQLAQEPAASISARVRPPVPLALFPPTRGYDDTPLTISDVLNTDAFAPQFRSWTTGSPSIPRRNETAPAADPSLRNAFTGLSYETG